MHPRAMAPALAVIAALASACGNGDDRGSTDPNAVGDAGLAGDAGAATDDPPATLLGAPLIFAPTSHGFGLSVVVLSGDIPRLQAAPGDGGLGARVRASGQS